MNFHGKDIKIFSGNSNVDVAQGIAGCLGLQLGKIKSDNAAGEYYLPDAIALLLKDGKTVGAYTAECSDAVLGANFRDRWALFPADVPRFAATWLIGTAHQFAALFDQ